MLANISCDSGNYTIGRISSGSFVNGGTAGFDAGDTTAQVVIAAGDNVSCTFTNTKNAQLTINKSTVGGNGIFNFSGAATSTITTSNGSGTDGGQTFTAGNFGTKTVTETVPTGWSLTNISCDSGSYTIGRISSGSFVNGGTAGFDAGDTTAHPALAASDHVSCTFTNTKNAQLTI